MEIMRDVLDRLLVRLWLLKEFTSLIPPEQHWSGQYFTVCLADDLVEELALNLDTLGEGHSPPMCLPKWGIY